MVDAEAKMYSETEHIGPFIVVMLTLHAVLVSTLIVVSNLQLG